MSKFLDWLVERYEDLIPNRTKWNAITLRHYERVHLIVVFDVVIIVIVDVAAVMFCTYMFPFVATANYLLSLLAASILAAVI